MKKKIYILAVTFLCLLCSQLSFGQPQDEGFQIETNYFDFYFEPQIEEFEREHIEPILNYLEPVGFIYPEITTTMDITNLIQTYQIEYNESNDDNFEINFYIDFVQNNFEFDSSYDSVQDFLIDSFIEYDSYINSIYPCSSGDYNDCYGNGGGDGSSTFGYDLNGYDSNGYDSNGYRVPTPTPELKNWYLDKDGDGYDAGTQTAETSPGAGWVEGASMGIDCDDNDPVIRECILPKPVEVINPAICKCIDPPNKPKFNNVTNIWNVLDGKKWIKFETNCNIHAREQIKQVSLLNSTPASAGNEINLFLDKKRQTESGKLTAEIDLQKAIDVIAKNLKEGKPVLAGVMYERYYGADKALGGTLGDNNNVATNHYVVIVGMGIDNGKPYFSYYDNFVDSHFKDGTPRSEATRELIGTNIYENRFYLYPDSVGNYYFSDKTAKTIDGPTDVYTYPYSHGQNNQYILTEIRDNF